MRKISLVSVFFILMVAVSFVYASSQKADFTPVNKAIIVNSNNRNFEITMQVNRTTGYDWYLTSYDNHFIMPLKREYRIINKKLIGSPGVEVWYFSLSKLAFIVPSNYNLVFTSMRPWDLSTQTKQRYVVVSSSER